MSKEFKLIISDSRTFEKDMTNALDDGWDLLGTPHLDGNRFLQGLIRHIKVPTIKEPEKKK
jgi:hypothetical protein|tara:strand:+ start:698 stop:880 length:183 start_codon:yes stop_codon:yes gene_type:complete